MEMDSVQIPYSHIMKQLIYTFDIRLQYNV